MKTCVKKELAESLGVTQNTISSCLKTMRIFQRQRKLDAIGIKANKHRKDIFHLKTAVLKENMEVCFFSLNCK